MISWSSYGTNNLMQSYDCKCTHSDGRADCYYLHFIVSLEGAARSEQ